MTKHSDWVNDLICATEWALRQEDLRHQFIHAEKAKNLQTVPGIAQSIETTLVLAIYEACLGKGYVDGKTIDYERHYPRRHHNKRADLALKDRGKGKNWGYIEIKRYHGGGEGIRKDIKKLQRIKTKSQRWMLVYRVRPKKGKKKNTAALKTFLSKEKFKKSMRITDESWRQFDTVAKNGSAGICEICLAEIRRST